MKTKLLLLAAALPLAGCISFGAKPPPSLLTLEASAVPAAGRQENSADARSIVVQVPTTPAAIAVTRVPVEATPTTLACHITNMTSHQRSKNICPMWKIERIPKRILRSP